MCKLCGRTPCHPSCPNAEERSTGDVCFYCGESICVGDEYLVSEAGNIVHADCFIGMDREEVFRFFGEEEAVCIAQESYEDDE